MSTQQPDSTDLESAEPLDPENASEIQSAGIKKINFGEFAKGTVKKKKIKLNRNSVMLAKELMDTVETTPPMGTDATVATTQQLHSPSKEVKKMKNYNLSETNLEETEFEKFEDSIKKLAKYNESDLTDYGLKKSSIEYEEMEGVELDLFCGFAGTMRDMRAVLYSLYRLDNKVSEMNSTLSETTKNLTATVGNAVDTTCLAMSQNVMTVHANCVSGFEKNANETSLVTNRLFEQCEKTNSEIKNANSLHVRTLEENILELKATVKNLEEILTKHLKTIAELKTENIVLTERLTEKMTKSSDARDELQVVAAAESNQRVNRSAQCLAEAAFRKKRVLNSLKF